MHKGQGNRLDGILTRIRDWGVRNGLTLRGFLLSLPFWHTPAGFAALSARLTIGKIIACIWIAGSAWAGIVKNISPAVIDEFTIRLAPPPDHFYLSNPLAAFLINPLMDRGSGLAGAIGASLILSFAAAIVVSVLALMAWATPWTGRLVARSFGNKAITPPPYGYWALTTCADIMWLSLFTWVLTKVAGPGGTEWLTRLSTAGGAAPYILLIAFVYFAAKQRTETVTRRANLEIYGTQRWHLASNLVFCALLLGLLYLLAALAR